jgi:hypothetical protein
MDPYKHCLAGENMTEILPIIPVYLNQRIVFDLLAMLEGGIATVERVSSLHSNNKEEAHRYGAEFGLSKALSGILKIGVSGSRDMAKASANEVQRDSEKYHTPASLFSNLRHRLQATGQIKQLDGTCAPSSEAFLEFTAPLERNPLIATLDSMASLMEIAVIFTATEKPGAKGKHGEKSDNMRIQKQIEGFTAKLKAGETVDIIASGLPSGYRAVLTLETEYLNDPTMSDIVDGQFSVLGKVVRIIDKADDRSISLLRKTALSIMPEKTLKDVFSNLSNIKDFQIPKLEWEIKGPVIQMIPIAIFA